MLGQLYDRALDGECCWLRHDDGRLNRLPVHSWLGGHGCDAGRPQASACLAITMRWIWLVPS